MYMNTWKLRLKKFKKKNCHGIKQQLQDLVPNAQESRTCPIACCCCDKLCHMVVWNGDT